jgi:peptidoglycan/LPS O-acetylase OafA/YrhL
MLWPRMRAWSVVAGLLLIGLGVGVFALEAAVVGDAFGRFISIDVYGWTRVILFGLPSAALVAGACICERRVRGRLAAWLAAQGDASYSLYLSHGLAVPLLAGTGLFVLRAGPIATAILVFIACVGIGGFTYKAIERPITRDLKRLRFAAHGRTLAEPAGG